MQPLLQHIFISICLKGSVISLEKLATKIKTFFFLCKFSFRSEVHKKCQKLPGHAVSQLLQFLTLNLKEGQESRYIQPSALGFI